MGNLGGRNMKIKNVRVFIASFIAFALIGTFNACQDYKVKHQSKTGDIIKTTAEDIKFEDIFTPVETEETTEIVEENKEIKQK